MFNDDLCGRRLNLIKGSLRPDIYNYGRQMQVQVWIRRFLINGITLFKYSYTQSA